MAIAISCSVPLYIAEIKQMGYATSDYQDSLREIADLITSDGDVLLYGGNKGEPAKIFNKLAKAVAFLAFQPGGISILEMHFEASF